MAASLRAAQDPVRSPRGKGLCPDPNPYPATVRGSPSPRRALTPPPDHPPARLTLAEIAILRMYTGPWFKAINFYLRYLPEVHCCSSTPYYEPLVGAPPGLCETHNPRRCFLIYGASSASDSSADSAICASCGKPKSEHSLGKPK